MSRLRSPRRGWFVAALAASLMVLPAVAGATQSPPGCTANNWGVAMASSTFFAHDGDTIDFEITISNSGPSACDVTDANVDVEFPDGSTQNLATAESYLANDPDVVYNVSYTTNEAVDGGAGFISTTVSGIGTLNRSPIGDEVATIEKNLTQTYVHPGIMIVKTPSRTLVSPGDSVTYTYEVTNTGDTPLRNVVVTDDKCSPVVFVGGDDGPNPGFLDLTETWIYECTTTLNETTVNVAVVVGEDFDGIQVRDDDTATVEVEAPAPAEGCTPGYWKQPHHFGSWVGYSPNDSFSAVFGVPYDKTLLEALKTGGGQEKALGRHAVAALLNTANSDVNFGLSEAEVIALVQDAWATGDFEGAKNQLAAENERGCDLGRNPGDSVAPTSDTVSIIQSIYRNRRDRVVIRARNDLGSDAMLTVTIDGYVSNAPMMFKGKRGTWVYVATNVGMNLDGLQVTVTSDAGGTASDTIR